VWEKLFASLVEISGGKSQKKEQLFQLKNYDRYCQKNVQGPVKDNLLKRVSGQLLHTGGWKRGPLSRVLKNQQPDRLPTGLIQEIQKNLGRKREKCNLSP